MAKTTKSQDTQVESPPSGTSTSVEAPAMLRELLERIEEGFAALRSDIASIRRDVGPGVPDHPRDAPPTIRVRTDGRRRHICAGMTFGREWKTVATAGLTRSAYESITSAPELEVNQG